MRFVSWDSSVLASRTILDGEPEGIQGGMSGLEGDSCQEDNLRLGKGASDGIQDHSSPLDRELRVLFLYVLAAAVIRCVPEIYEPGESSPQRCGPLSRLHEVPMDRPLDGGVLGMGNLLQGEQGGDRVESRVISPRRGGVWIIVDQRLRGSEGLSRPGPVIQSLRAHR